MINRSSLVRLALAAPLAFALSGCIASAVGAAVAVATAPIKIVSKAADLATTSQSEADENRGRRLRAQEERLGQLARKRNKAQDKCEDGSESACRDVEAINAEIEAERTKKI